jgi:uncharacterized protein (TIRG00374 family)
VHPKAVKAAQFTFFLLIGCVLLYFAFRGIDLRQLTAQIKQADYRWVAVSTVFGFLALIFRTFRWQLLLEPAYTKIKKSHILHAINIGYLANFVFPRIGEITRCGVLNRTDKLPVDAVFGTVIVERIFDVLMTFCMLALILAIRFDMVGSFMLHHVFEPAFGRMSGGTNLVWMVIILILTAGLMLVLCKRFGKQMAQITVLRKIKGWLIGMLNGIRSIYKVKNFAWFLLLNVLVFGMYFMQVYTMFFALHTTAHLGMVDALFILVISSLSFIIPVQGGIGAYHWIVSIGLTVFGLSREEGMVYATLSHSITSLMLIVLGGISLLFIFRIHRWTQIKTEVVE